MRIAILAFIIFSCSTASDEKLSSISKDFYNISLDFLSQKKDDKALEYLEKALELNPDFIDANYNYALLLAKKNRFAESLRIIKDKLDNANDLVLEIKAYDYAALNQNSEAEIILTDLLTRNSSSSKLHRNLAKVTASIEIAKSSYLKSIELEPENFKIRDEFLSFLDKNQLLDDKIALLRATVNLEKVDDKYRFSLAEMLLTKSEYLEARGLAQAILSANKTEVKYAILSLKIELKLAANEIAQKSLIDDFVKNYKISSEDKKGLETYVPSQFLPLLEKALIAKPEPSAESPGSQR